MRGGADEEDAAEGWGKDGCEADERQATNPIPGEDVKIVVTVVEYCLPPV